MTEPTTKAFPKEPKMVINGVELSEAQAMSVRVAIGAYMLDLTFHGLGNDEHGVAMTAAYKDRLSEVARIMSRTELQPPT